MFYLLTNAVEEYFHVHYAFSCSQIVEYAAGIDDFRYECNI